VVDDQRVLAWLTLASAASSGHEIATIEGLADGDGFHPMQRFRRGGRELRSSGGPPGSARTAGAAGPVDRLMTDRTARIRVVDMDAAARSAGEVPTMRIQQPHDEARPSEPADGSVMSVRFVLNGEPTHCRIDPRTTLLDLLRERLQLTGTKKGCNRGECGSCTLLLDGRRVNSCLVLAVGLDGREVVTIEGLAGDGSLHPVQRAFIESDAFQCGFCTPGQIMSAVGCIREGHVSDAAEIREWMSGNFCRCSAYPQITAAVAAAAGTGDA
jgi:xanthine dehydrogenase YagT iron-sulfur-binding subunit